MFLLSRGLPVLLELGLTIYCLIDCVQTPEISVRNLPKWAWIVLILFFPLIGSIAWLVAGRPARGEPVGGYRTGFPADERPGRRSLAPDDDPEYLRELGRVNNEQAQTLDQWEADLKRREEELRRHGDEPPPTPAP